MGTSRLASGVAVDESPQLACWAGADGRWQEATSLSGSRLRLNTQSNLRANGCIVFFAIANSTQHRRSFQNTQPASRGIHAIGWRGRLLVPFFAYLVWFLQPGPASLSLFHLNGAGPAQPTGLAPAYFHEMIRRGIVLALPSVFLANNLNAARIFSRKEG